MSGHSVCTSIISACLFSLIPEFHRPFDEFFSPVVFCASSYRFLFSYTQWGTLPKNTDRRRQKRSFLQVQWFAVYYSNAQSALHAYLNSMRLKKKKLVCEVCRWCYVGFTLPDMQIKMCHFIGETTQHEVTIRVLVHLEASTLRICFLTLNPDFFWRTIQQNSYSYCFLSKSVYVVITCKFTNAQLHPRARDLRFSRALLYCINSFFDNFNVNCVLFLFVIWIFSASKFSAVFVFLSKPVAISNGLFWILQ